MRYKILKLGEICEFQGGSQPPKSNFIFEPKKNYIRFIQIRDFKSDKNLTYIPISEKNNICKNNDILIGRYGASVGKILTGLSGAYNVALMKIIPNEKIIDKKFLYYYLISDLFQKPLKKISERSAQNGFSKDNIYNFSITLPTLSEQQRIVAKLDAAFAEIDKALDTNINIQKNIKNITKLFFNNIENKNLISLCENDIGELCNLMTGGTPNTKNKSYYKDGKIPWLVSGDVNKGIINDCKGRITELGYKNSNAKYLPINSVIIALNGQGKTRGTVALLKIKATCNQSLVSIYPKDEKKISVELIFYYLKSKYKQIRKITGDGGNDRRGLNMPLIRKIKIKYPESYQEQIKLVNKIKTISEEVMKMEKNCQSKINNLLKLKQSILKNSLIKKDFKAA